MPTTKEPTIKKEIAVLEDKIKTFSITTVDDMPKATELLSILNKNLKQLTEEKEKITKPMNEALKEVRGRYKPMETILEEGIAMIRKAMSDFQTAQRKAELVEEQKIASRLGEGSGKFKAETVIKKIDALEKAPEIHATSQGMVKFRTDKRLKITDTEAIKKYIIATGDFSFIHINEKELFEYLKLGHVVPGAEVEEIQTPINIRA